MHISGYTAAAAALGASLVSAVPLRRQSSDINACANITEQLQEAVAANRSTFYADGELAYNCLQSLPFNSELGSSFVSEITKYLQFQSTIPFLKNPPNTYLSQPVDLLGGLEAIFAKANTSQYQSQYQMDTDIYNLIASANDGHLSVFPCSLSIFTFDQITQLVSVSTDGVSLPKIYTVRDAVLMNNGSTEISDVVTVNGMDVVQFVEKLGSTQNAQDPDAQWNDVFPSQARAIGGGNGLGAFSVNNGLWPGTPENVLGFRNGTTYTSRIRATVQLGRKFNFTNSEELWTAVCVPANTTSEQEPAATSSEAPSSTSEAPSSTSSVNPTSTTGPESYPTPILRDPYNTISGYYLDGEFNDTAVMFVPTFETAGEGLPDWEEANFAEVASAFVNQSLADGKTKMIIDVSGNGGGVILSGFDLFKLFFPDLEPYSATRLRDHPAERLTIKAGSTLNYTTEVGESPFYYASQVEPDQTTKFDTWEDFYGPDVINGANMSSLYANFPFNNRSDELDPIRGYGGVPLNVTGRPFAKENLLIVSDGYCASTCTTFVTLMTNPDVGGGVASIAFGGRPINYAMQVMGGVRGGQSAGWDYLAGQVNGAYQWALNTTNTSQPALSSEELELFAEVMPSPLETFPLVLGSGSLNLRNAYGPEDDNTPLQFAYQAADCKIFYTTENILEPATTWARAASVAWGNGSCVTGSTNNTWGS